MPKIFIGSSTPGSSEAHALKTGLNGIAEVIVWNQEGVFRLSTFTLEVLEHIPKEFDFGIFLMRADDLRQKNQASATSAVTRDNVVFELGLFIGALGRRRAFVLVPKGIRNHELPTDLLGLTVAFYEILPDGNFDFTSAVKQIEYAIGAYDDSLDNEEHILGRTATLIDTEPGIRRNVRQKGSLIHHMGRLAPIYTGNFLREAEKEICIIGLSLRSFISYFDSRPRTEIREPIVEALKRGVSVSFSFLNPESYYAKHLESEGEDKQIVGQIKSSIDLALKLRPELEMEANGKKLSIRLYSHFPFGQVKLVDPSLNSGRILGYHYLTLKERPRIPYFELKKETNPILFSVYSDAMAELLHSSREI